MGESRAATASKSACVIRAGPDAATQGVAAARRIAIAAPRATWPRDFAVVIMRSVSGTSANGLRPEPDSRTNHRTVKLPNAWDFDTDNGRRYLPKAARSAKPTGAGNRRLMKLGKQALTQSQAWEVEHGRWTRQSPVANDELRPFKHAAEH